MRKIIFYTILGLIFGACSQNITKNKNFQVSLQGNDLLVKRSDGSTLEMKPTFTVVYAQKDPDKKLRYGDFGYKKKPHEELGIKYHVPTWGKVEEVNIDSKEHVMDGFNPEIDRGFGEGRTANLFIAGSTMILNAKEIKVNGNKVEWFFPENEYVSLKAYATINKGDGYPSINYDFVAKKDGYFSVGYTGAPEYNADECSEIFQSVGKAFSKCPLLIRILQNQSAFYICDKIRYDIWHSRFSRIHPIYAYTYN